MCDHCLPSSGGRGQLQDHHHFEKKSGTLGYGDGWSLTAGLAGTLRPSCSRRSEDPMPNRACPQRGQSMNTEKKDPSGERSPPRGSHAGAGVVQAAASWPSKALCWGRYWVTGPDGEGAGTWAPISSVTTERTGESRSKPRRAEDVLQAEGRETPWQCRNASRAQPGRQTSHLLCNHDINT